MPQSVYEISDCGDVDDECCYAWHCSSAGDLVNLQRDEKSGGDNGQVFGPSALVPQAYALDHVESGVEKNNYPECLYPPRTVAADHDERFQDVRMRCAARESDDPVLKTERGSGLKEVDDPEADSKKPGDFYELEDRDDLDELIALAPAFLFVCRCGSRAGVDIRLHPRNLRVKAPA